MDQQKEKYVIIQDCHQGKKCFGSASIVKLARKTLRHHDVGASKYAFLPKQYCN